MAYSLIKFLREQASEGKTIICTIHQPSSRIFNMFDKYNEIKYIKCSLAFKRDEVKVRRFSKIISFFFHFDKQKKLSILKWTLIVNINGSNEKSSFLRVHGRLCKV